MLIHLPDDSGRIYPFDTDPWPQSVSSVAGLYVVLRPPITIWEHLEVRPNVLYLGRSDNLNRRTVQELYSHHRYGDFRLLGATDIAVWYAGPYDDIAAAELALKRSLNPALNDQPEGILNALDPDYRSR